MDKLVILLKKIKTTGHEIYSKIFNLIMYLDYECWYFIISDI